VFLFFSYLFAKLPQPGDSKVTFASLSQAAILSTSLWWSLSL